MQEQHVILCIHAVLAPLMIFMPSITLDFDYIGNLTLKYYFFINFKHAKLSNTAFLYSGSNKFVFLWTNTT